MLHVNNMTSLNASSVAALLREFGQRSALRGGNPFRAKAYARAADNLLALSLPLDQVIAQDRLREIPGVGDAIADIVKKLHATGTPPANRATCAARSPRDCGRSRLSLDRRRGSIWWCNAGKGNARASRDAIAGA